MPPGMIGGEVDVGSEEGGIETIDEAAFVLANGDGLLGTSGTNRFTDSTNPAGKFFLGEENVVINAQ